MIVIDIITGYLETLGVCFVIGLGAGAVTAARLWLAARRDFPRVRVVKL